MSRFCFRQKQFGYGATPNSWQGWLFTLAGISLVAGVVFMADFIRDDTMRLLLIAIGLPMILIPAIWISHAKTEGGWRWHWGPKD